MAAATFHRPMHSSQPQPFDFGHSHLPGGIGEGDKGERQHVVQGHDDRVRPPDVVEQRVHDAVEIVAALDGIHEVDIRGHAVPYLPIWNSTLKTKTNL